MLPVVPHRRPGPGSVRNRNSFDACKALAYGLGLG